MQLFTWRTIIILNYISRLFTDLQRNILSSLSVEPVKEDDQYAMERNKEEDDYIHEAGFEYERQQDDFANVCSLLLDIYILKS